MKYRTKIKMAIRDFKLLFKRKRENKFDYIFSLGYNCEIAYRLYDYFKFEESSLLNWAGTYSTEHLIEFFNNFEKLGTQGYEGPNPFWKCKATNLRMHGKVNMNDYINKIADEETIRKDKEDLIGRMSYLKEKFIKIAKSSAKKLYAYKLRNNEINENIYDVLNRLYEAMENFGIINFKLLVIYEKQNSEILDKIADKCNKNIILRSVDYFAPDDRVTDRTFQNNGFDRIWDEFYCTQKSKKKKKKKYKFEQ